MTETTKKSNLPVAVIGGGPVGLAAAAHLLARGLTPIVFEAGEAVGAHVSDWAHVRMFSPWEFNVDQAAVQLLERHGWAMPPADALPTGGELVADYLTPLANTPELHDRIHTGARVVAVSRRDIDKMKDAGRDDAPFLLHVAYDDGGEALHEARAVIDASGTWGQPNPLGSGGLPAIGERAAQDHIRYGIPDVLGGDAARYAGKRVMVVGAGHSAINAVLELAQLREHHPNTRVIWALRGANVQKVLGGGDDDALPARGALGTRTAALMDAGVVEMVAPFRVRRIEMTANGLCVIGEANGDTATIEADEIIAATGSRPNLEMIRELRTDIDASLESAATLAPMIDPNIHSCGTVPPHGEAELRHPERDFYVVGMKSYGRAPTFLLATGYEQVRSVVAALAGDTEAARDVQLALPETGVCSTDGPGGGCCAPEPIAAGTISLDAIPVSGGNLIEILPTSGENAC